MHIPNPIPLCLSIIRNNCMHNHPTWIIFNELVIWQRNINYIKLFEIEYMLCELLIMI